MDIWSCVPERRVPECWSSGARGRRGGAAFWKDEFRISGSSSGPPDRVPELRSSGSGAARRIRNFWGAIRNVQIFCFALLFGDCWGATVKKLLRRNHLRRRSCQSHRTFHFVPHFISCEDKTQESGTPHLVSSTVHTATIIPPRPAEKRNAVAAPPHLSPVSPPIFA